MNEKIQWLCALAAKVVSEEHLPVTEINMCLSPANGMMRIDIVCKDESYAYYIAYDQWDHVVSREELLDSSAEKIVEAFRGMNSFNMTC